MRLDVQYAAPGLADGVYRVCAPGHASASLCWADEHSMTDGFTALAHVPLDEEGRGEFRLEGSRAVPPSAAQIAVRCAETVKCMPVPDAQRKQPLAPSMRLCLMSDLHLSAKPWRIRLALRAAVDCDAILLAGDLTNDGLPRQFEQLRQIIDEEAPHTPVLAVCGNHDFPVMPLPFTGEGAQGYYAFQRWLLDRASALGVEVEEDPCGAYAARLGDLSILGLNAATHFRRFTFHQGQQVNWLDARLRNEEDGWKIVLCHAPLRRHQPVRGKEAPYLGSDKRLQQIVDGAKNVIFHSGHTHITLNELVGCVDRDDLRGNVYVNDSSVCPPCFRVKEPAEDREWVESAVVNLNIAQDEIEISARTIRSGKAISRAYYRFARI